MTNNLALIQYSKLISLRPFNQAALKVSSITAGRVWTKENANVKLQHLDRSGAEHAI